MLTPFNIDAECCTPPCVIPRWCHHALYPSLNCIPVGITLGCTTLSIDVEWCKHRVESTLCLQQFAGLQRSPPSPNALMYLTTFTTVAECIDVRPYNIQHHGRMHRCSLKTFNCHWIDVKTMSMWSPNFAGSTLLVSLKANSVSPWFSGKC